MSFFKRRPPEPLCAPQRSTLSPSVFALLALLLIASVSADHDKSVARIVASVPATDCKFPFSFNKIDYYGCTTANDTKAWCIVKEPKEGQDWRYCATDTLSKVASLAEGDNKKCLNGWSLGSEKVYGCAKSAGDSGFSCKLDSGSVACDKLVPTMVGAAAAGSLATTVANVAHSSLGLVIAAVGGALVVALVAGLIVARRSKDGGKAPPHMHSQWDYKHGDMHAPYGFASETGLLAPGSSLAAERLYTVISTYTPTLGDELEIQPGDKVSILVEYDDGWCQGVNHTRGGTKGVFPKHCVDTSG